MNRVSRFIGLTSLEKALIVRASLWLLFFRVGLFLAPTWFAKKWVRDGKSVGVVDQMADEPTIDDIVRAVRQCQRYVPYATCLTQALTARRMLSRYGHDAVLKIGVAKSDSRLEAHAWVEVNGRVVLGKQPFHSRYTVLESPRPVLI